MKMVRYDIRARLRDGTRHSCCASGNGLSASFMYQQSIGAFISSSCVVSNPKQAKTQYLDRLNYFRQIVRYLLYNQLLPQKTHGTTKLHYLFQSTYK